jgi:hypothetical protein
MKRKAMKALYPLFAVLLFAGCFTTHPANETTPDSETVMIIYHPKAGSEADLQATLAQAWQVYQSEHAVFERPHVLVRDTEDGNKARFVEIFTWKQAPDHPAPEIQAIWKQEQSLCEARDGHKAIEGGEVQLVPEK